MLSPYAELCADFFNQLNAKFLEIFELQPEFRGENILPGDRFGIISVSGFEEDNSKSYGGSNVRGGGFEAISMKMDVILRSGIATYIEGEAEKARLALDLDHGISLLKQYFPNEGLISAFKAERNYRPMLSQAKSQQGNVANAKNSWIATVTTTATALIIIKTDFNGLHLMR